MTPTQSSEGVAPAASPAQYSSEELVRDPAQQVPVFPVSEETLTGKIVYAAMNRQAKRSGQLRADFENGYKEFGDRREGIYGSARAALDKAAEPYLKEGYTPENRRQAIEKARTFLQLAQPTIPALTYEKLSPADLHTEMSVAAKNLKEESAVKTIAHDAIELVRRIDAGAQDVRAAWQEHVQRYTNGFFAHKAYTTRDITLAFNDRFPNQVAPLMTEVEEKETALLDQLSAGIDYRLAVHLEKSKIEARGILHMLQNETEGIPLTRRDIKDGVEYGILRETSRGVKLEFSIAEGAYIEELIDQVK